MPRIDNTQAVTHKDVIAPTMGSKEDDTRAIHWLINDALLKMYEIQPVTRSNQRDKIDRLSKLASEAFTSVGETMKKRGRYNAYLAGATLFFGSIGIYGGDKTTYGKIFSMAVNSGFLNQLFSCFDKMEEGNITVKQFQANQKQNVAQHLQSGLDKDDPLRHFEAAHSAAMKVSDMK